MLMSAMFCLALCHCVSGYGEDDLFERYSKMRLLTSCLGQETMSRWHEQMMVASRSCQNTAPSATPPPPILKPAGGPSAFSQQEFLVEHRPSGFRPNIPTHFQQHQFYPISVRPQYLHKVNYRPVPQTKFHFPAQKFYYLTRPFQQKKLHSSFYPKNLHPVQLTGVINQGNFVPFSDQPQIGITAGLPVQTQQQGIPIASQLTTSEGSQPIANDGFLPITNEGSQPTSEDSTPPFTQEDTYTNPAIKYEDTEQYQEQQKRLEAYKQSQSNHQPYKERTNHGTYSHHHQHYHSLLHSSHGVHKREAEPLPGFAKFAPSSRRYPEYAPQESQDFQLRSLRSSVSDKLSNMTCVLQAMKLLTDELIPDYTFMSESLLELPITDQLYTELQSGLEYCRTLAQCVPHRPQLHQIALSKNLSSSLEFFRCFGKEKLRACLKQDVKAMAQLLDPVTTHPNAGIGGLPPVRQSQRLDTALADIENLLNGGTGQFIDLVLM